MIYRADLPRASLARISRIKANTRISQGLFRLRIHYLKAKLMSLENSVRSPSAHVIVVGNEKGGAGKSTVAMHIAVALMKSGQGVATIDLDTRQKSFSNLIENRRTWA